MKLAAIALIALLSSPAVAQTCPPQAPPPFSCDSIDCLDAHRPAQERYVAQLAACNPVEICRKHFSGMYCHTIPDDCTTRMTFDAGFEGCRVILEVEYLRGVVAAQAAAEAQAKIDAATRERELAIVRDAAKTLENGR